MQVAGRARRGEERGRGDVWGRGDGGWREGWVEREKTRGADDCVMHPLNEGVGGGPVLWMGVGNPFVGLAVGQVVWNCFATTTL